MPDALPGSQTTPSYTVMGETVVDNVTHLVWQRNVPNTYEGCVGKYSVDGGVMGDACTLEEAKQYCASASLAAALGGSGWRLPTKIELESIIDETRYDPAINTEAFPKPPSGGFWTATPYAANPGRGWVVLFQSGSTWGSEEPSYPNRVRCVR